MSVPIVKVQVPKKRQTRGAKYPWVVYALDGDAPYLRCVYEADCEGDADEFIEDTVLRCPVKVYVEIPPIEY